MYVPLDLCLVPSRVGLAPVGLMRRVLVFKTLSLNQLSVESHAERGAGWMRLPVEQPQHACCSPPAAERESKSRSAALEAAEAHKDAGGRGGNRIALRG